MISCGPSLCSTEIQAWGLLPVVENTIDYFPYSSEDDLPVGAPNSNSVLGAGGVSTLIALKIGHTARRVYRGWMLSALSGRPGGESDAGGALNAGGEVMLQSLVMRIAKLSARITASGSHSKV